MINCALKSAVRHQTVTLATALLLTSASQAAAECGNLCNPFWWKYQSPDLQAELDGGADVMARGEGGMTPLHSAAHYGTLEHIQALLAAGADVTARAKDGSTPLHLAARYGTPENVQALIDAGADAKAKTINSNRRGT
jgi:ankyrin repeat protein